MSSITDYFERIVRKEYLHPSSKAPIIGGGILFLSAGCFLIANHNPTRAGAWLAVGVGMILYAITEIRFRDRRWRIPVLFAAVVLWFSGVGWAVYQTIR